MSSEYLNVALYPITLFRYTNSFNGKLYIDLVYTRYYAKGFRASRSTDMLPRNALEQSTTRSRAYDCQEIPRSGTRSSKGP